MGDGLSLSPLATLSTGWSGHGGFSESGAGALNITTGARSDWRLDAGLGVELVHRSVLNDGSRLSWRGRALWNHALGENRPDATVRLAGGGGAFDISGPEGSRSRLMLGAGLAYQPSEMLSLSLDYLGEISGSAGSHAGKLGLRLAF